MTSDTAAPISDATAEAPPIPPLFYTQPEPLFPGAHRDFKIRPDFDYSFAAPANSIPLTGPEFAHAARHYPIIFLGAELVPTIAVGFAQSGNFYVNSKGEWDPTTYIPAYVRRYPFILLGQLGDDTLSLGVDSAAASSKDGARALFADDKETDVLKWGKDFCEQFHGAFLMTRDFSKALQDAGVTEEAGVDITSPTGEVQRAGGFRRVVEERLRALPDATVADWHKKGYLSLAYFHLQSLTNWDQLMRKGQQAGVGA